MATSAEHGGQPIDRAVDGGRNAIARLGDFRLDLRDRFGRRGQLRSVRAG